MQGPDALSREPVMENDSRLKELPYPEENEYETEWGELEDDEMYLNVELWVVEELAIGSWGEENNLNQDSKGSWIVPPGMRKALLELYHDEGAHPGVNKTLRKLRAKIASNNILKS